MKQIILIFASFVLLMVSCEKPNECSNDIGCWGDEDDIYYIFINEDINFYCLNGPVSIGIANADNPRGDRLRLWGYPYYLDQKDDGFNRSSDAFIGRSEKGVFDAYCYDTRKDKNLFNTYVVVDNYDEITKDTKEVYCRLEYRKYLWDIKRYYTVVDSMRTTFKRVN